MKIKQTVKQVLIGLVLATGISSLFTAPTYSASCGGVDTGVISCNQTGSCPNGKNPYEGTDPKGDSTKEAKYLSDYNHPYGKCTGGADPKISVEDSGVWGLLLIAINILTAGIGVAAVAGIVYGSVLYTSAGGSPEQVKKAMGIISNVAIGIVAYALMYALLNFIIPGGLFT